jgi:hypothetical protein
MKAKRVNRYYCDFCGKSGCSAYHIRRHEERCTLNPDRKCGMPECYTSPAELAEAVASIPDVKQFVHQSGDDLGDWEWFDIPNDTVAAVLADLEQRLDACPVCMYAALRRAGWAGMVREQFNLKERIADCWNEANRAEERARYGY